MPGPRPRAEHGFTLLEVLIAFVIMALALGVMFRGVVASLRATRVAGQYAEGLSRAQSHLEAILAPGVGVIARNEQGEEGNGYRWSIDVAPVATAPAIHQRAADGSGPRLSLYTARVTESWSGAVGHGAVTLATELIGPPPP